MIISNNTSADFLSISADVLLKMITILKELRVAQVCSFKKWTDFSWLHGNSTINSLQEQASFEVLIAFRELRQANLGSAGNINLFSTENRFDL